MLAEVLNDTATVAAVRFGASEHGPSVAVGVGQSDDMRFGTDALASFVVTLEGRTARVKYVFVAMAVVRS